MKVVIILCLLTTSLCAQIEPFVQGGFETFYTWNRFAVMGAQWREHKLGLFHQEARINPDGYFLRQGIYAEAYLGNVDKIAYFYAGGRFAQSNDQFFGFTPHGTVAWRINKYVEIPQTLSIYASRFVASIGLRVMLRREPRNKVQNTKRRALQPTSVDPKPSY